MRNKRIARLRESDGLAPIKLSSVSIHSARRLIAYYDKSALLFKCSKTMLRKLNLFSFASIVVGFCLSSFGQEATPKPDEQTVVSLIDAGAEPKIKLRMTPAKGTKQTSIMTMKMDQTIVMSGQDLPATPTPAMQFSIEVAVTDVASNGDFTFEYAYPKVGLVDDESAPSLVKQTMKSMLKSIEGMSGSAVMSNRGFTQKSDLNLPPKSNAQVKAMIDRHEGVDEPLECPSTRRSDGVGGKWSVTQLVEVNGMKLKQTSIHTLNKIDRRKYDVSIEGDAIGWETRSENARIACGGDGEIGVIGLYR